MLVVRGGPYMKEYNGISLRCWKCLNFGHVRYKCLDGATLEKGYE